MARIEFIVKDDLMNYSYIHEISGGCVEDVMHQAEARWGDDYQIIYCHDEREQDAMTRGIVVVSAMSE